MSASAILYRLLASIPVGPRVFGHTAHARRSHCSVYSKTIRLCSIVAFEDWMVRLVKIIAAVLRCINRTATTVGSVQECWNQTKQRVYLIRGVLHYWRVWVSARGFLALPCTNLVRSSPNKNCCWCGCFWMASSIGKITLWTASVRLQPFQITEWLSLCLLEFSSAAAVSLHLTAVCNHPNSIKGGWIQSVAAELLYRTIECGLDLIIFYKLTNGQQHLLCGIMFCMSVKLIMRLSM